MTHHSIVVHADNIERSRPLATGGEFLLFYGIERKKTDIVRFI